jgi:hypothetical protein
MATYVIPVRFNNNNTQLAYFQAGEVVSPTYLPPTIAYLTSTNIYTKAQVSQQQTLTSSGGSITFLLANSNEFVHTATENTTLANPADIASYVGSNFNIVFIQNSSSAKTLAFGSYFKSNDGTTQTVSTTLSAVNTIVCHVDTSTQITYSIIKHGVA